MADEKTQRNDAIIARYRDDKANLRTIGAEFGISHERVRQIVARVPGLLRTNRFTRRKDVSDKLLARMVKGGVPLAEMSEKLNMGETNLRVRLRAAGLSIPGRRAAR